MLQLVFELGQVLDDTLALFALLLVGLVAHGAMQVVDRASLSRQIQHTSTFPPCSQRKDTLFSYQNHRPSVMRRHICEARLVGGKVFRYDVWRG